MRHVHFSSFGLALCAVAAAGCGAEPLDQATWNASERESLTTASGASGSEIGVQRLRSKERAVFWKGAVGAADAPLAGAPPECASVPCDHVKLRIELPPDTFTHPQRPGGVQVALR